MPSHLSPALVEVLRAVRAGHSRFWGSLVAAVPALEPAFIRAGRGPLARWQLGRHAYWFAEEDLVRRLRQSGRRFRRVDVAGQRLHVDVTDATGRLHYFHAEPYEPLLAQAIADRLGAGDVFVDVGANIGFFSILAARLVGATGHVAAFEPHPEALAVFRKAVAINDLQQTIDVVEAAVGSGTAETIPLHLSIDSVLSSTDPHRTWLGSHFGFTKSIEVPLLTLDRWTASRPDLARRIAAIKIDVEGTELDVLEGMAATIAQVPAATIFCETSAGSAADIWLRARGYRVSALDVRRDEFGNYRYAR